MGGREPSAFIVLRKDTARGIKHGRVGNDPRKLLGAQLFGLNIPARYGGYRLLVDGVITSIVGLDRVQGAQVSGGHHVLAQALQQRLSGAGRADAARATLNAQVLQHERLQGVMHLGQAAPGLRSARAPVSTLAIVQLQRGAAKHASQALGRSERTSCRAHEPHTSCKGAPFPLPTWWLRNAT